MVLFFLDYEDIFINAIHERVIRTFFHQLVVVTREFTLYIKFLRNVFKKNF
jgi:hypothetical protein